MFLVLIGSLLGECIGWTTQQAGRVVHDIAPIKAHQHEQLGSGSEQLLWWHTEDAFHPLRGDYIGMFCLRNPDRVPTTFANLKGLGELSADQRRLLMEPHFTIRPDNSHQQKVLSDIGAQAAQGASYDAIERMNERPDKIAVLFGDPAEPYARLDPYFMDPVEDPPGAQQALDALKAILDRDLRDLVLQPGDVCFIDNFQGVHGRKPFKARYDGTDRWMKRVNVVRDLRKSREIRASSTSRIMN
ncbi:MAG: TauD/TfdA family dioxygenase [Acidobacteria bacterium]|nr:TauD/TfdA family dioxygenase [Acidobacteriota bacterium]